MKKTILDMVSSLGFNSNLEQKYRKSDNMEVDKSNEREIHQKRPPSPNHSVKSSLTANNAYVKHRKRSGSKDSKRSCDLVRDRQLDQRHMKSKHPNDRDSKSKHRRPDRNDKDSPPNNYNKERESNRHNKSPIRNRPDSFQVSSKNPIDEKSLKRKLFEEYNRRK